MPRPGTEPPDKQRPSHDLATLIAWLGELQDSGFYGTVTLHFRGRLVSVVKQQVLKPWDPLT